MRTGAGPGERVGVLGEEQVDHEPDDLARGVVLAGGLVAHFRELAQQLLEDVAHRLVRDDVRVQLDVSEVAQHRVQDTGLVQPGDRRVVVVLLQHVRSAR
ncbi:MAG TPA: hypothetical protein VGJ38_10330, partial [Jatrophihabitantaceae bacterium]